MWEHFESSTKKLEIKISRGARGFGIELAANYVMSIASDSPAKGKLEMHDVVIAIDGALLNDRTLAEALDPAVNEPTFTVIRPGPPYVNPRH